MFCVPRHIFGGAEGIGSCFNALRSWTRFRRYRGSRLPSSCFTLPDSFSAVLRVSSPVLMFALPDSFSAIMRASTPDFMF
jgi:hypothetical protein